MAIRMNRQERDDRFDHLFFSAMAVVILASVFGIPTDFTLARIYATICR